MLYPNLFQEKLLQRRGFKYIAGLDEVGRGAWAGPIVAAAVILDPKVKIKGIKDSKLLRSVERNKMFDKITNHAIAWSTGIISANKIDKIGLGQANVLVMLEALKKISPQPDYLLTDYIPLTYLDIACKAITDGDYKVTSIAAASIVAKVVRDRIMEELDEKYPHYSFKQHKGYGTNHHFHMISKYGICEIHRKSFEPIKPFLNN